MQISAFIILGLLSASHLTMAQSSWQNNEYVKLFKGYSVGNRVVAPMAEMKTTVPPMDYASSDPKASVTAQLWLISIISVEEALDKITLGGMLSVKWNTTAAGFAIPTGSKVKDVTYNQPMNDVWTPKMVVVNQLNGDSQCCIDLFPISLFQKYVFSVEKFFRKFSIVHQCLRRSS